MKFKPIIKRNSKPQSFDRTKIFVEKQGKKINCYDAIQEAREDTEIYEVLNKYGSYPDKLLDAKGAYADFTTFEGMRELKDQQMQAENMFYNLPIKIRQQFNNNIHTFIKEGKGWLENKIAEMAPKTPVQPEVTVPSTQPTETTKGA